MALDEEIERLYGLPLDQFTAARNALAKELRRDDREAADRVNALRKPTAAAWALNQAVRRAPEALEEYLEAGRELRAAHEELLAGGEREPVETASARERAAASALAEEAERAAGGGSPALRDRVAGTLRAAVADEEARAELEAGRLVRDREAVGLGPLAASGAPSKRAGGRRSSARDRERAVRRELKEARERHQRAQRRLRDAGQSVAAARERAEAAMETLERAQREEEKARTAAEDAEAEAEALERRLK